MGDPDGAFGSWLRPGPNMVGEFNELSLYHSAIQTDLFFSFLNNVQ